jgi:hypothetical protein
MAWLSSMLFAMYFAFQSIIAISQSDPTWTLNFVFGVIAWVSWYFASRNLALERIKPYNKY